MVYNQSPYKALHCDRQLNPAILDVPGVVFIDDLDVGSQEGNSFLFADPLEIITASSIDDIHEALQVIDRYMAQGKYLAGYITYESGLALDKPVDYRHNPDIPLLWYGVYDSVNVFEYQDITSDNIEIKELVKGIHLNISEDEYLACIERIKDYIADGDVYQVNYTCKLLFENQGTPAGLFARLRKAHPVCHSAFINTGDFQVISLSPELFLRKTGSKLITRPMKGTVHRGKSWEEDICNAEFLRLDEKNRAENVMIVDLMRNDLGRISLFGGVSVLNLFHIERYRSVFQMTSEVEGTLPLEVTVSDILKKTFPPGSITGTPKIRAMEIINELEAEPRGVYCGSIGMFRPDGDFLFNVAIRTIIQKGSACELGIGSGIVADSDPDAELRETLLKGKFLEAEPVDFRLLETLLYQVGKGYAYPDEHVERMQQSARFFGRRFDPALVRETLNDTAHRIESSQITCGKARVRLLVNENGEVEAEWTELDALDIANPKLLLSTRRIDPDDIFLYHKTTRRNDYDNDLLEARKQGFFDVLYLNNRDELAECSMTNLMLMIDGQWFTPPVSSGILSGIWRSEFMREVGAVERVLTLDDLRRANRVVVGNSVRGSIEIRGLLSAGQEVW